MPATRYPNAVWKPLPAGNFRPGGVRRPPRGLVLHIAQGDSLSGVWNWQVTNHKVSSYFIVGKDGTVWQPVDLGDLAWTEGDGNPDWIGVEHCGWATGPLTDAQLNATAGILAWLHREYGVPLVSTDDPVNGRGLGWHGMGAAAWGGHPACPGEPIKAQRPELLARATALVTPPAPPSPISEETPVKLMRGDATPEVWLVGATAKPVHLTGDTPGVPGTYGPWLMWCVQHVPGSVNPDTNREWVVPQRMIDALVKTV